MATGIESFLQAPTPSVEGQPASKYDIECSSDDCNSLSNTSKDQFAGENKDSDFSTAEKTMMKYESIEIFHTPLCMIDSDPNGNLKINEDVLDQIAKIDSALSIVTITGPYRTGKSYLFNRLAGINKGFQVGSTAKAVTKGIWVWCRLHPKCKDQVILLLDTEGLGNIEEDQGHVEDQQLTIAILLCSMFIYNFRGALDRSVLDKLQFVTTMSKRIQLSDTKSDEDRNDLDLYLPFFLLVLRDFDFDVDGGDEDAYFENSILSLQQNCGPKEKMFNETRMCIRNYFKRRKCFTFVTPGTKEIVNNMQNVQDEQIHAEFITKCRQFTEFVYSKCPSKRLYHGRPIDGEKFAILTRCYVEEIKKGMVPKVKNVLNMMTQEMNGLAVQRCIELYKSEMASRLQFPTSSDTTLLEAHKICADRALSLFLKVSISEEDGKFLKLANEHIFTAYENFKLQDETASIQKSETVLEVLGADITTKIKTKSYLRSGGYNMYRKDIKELERKYKETNGLGCKKDETWSKYLSDKCADEDQVMMVDAELSVKDKEIEGQRKKIEEAELRQLYMQRTLTEQKIMSRNTEELLINSFKMQKIKHQNEMDKEKQHYTEILEKRLKEQERLLKEGSDEKAKLLYVQIDNLKERLIEMERLKEKVDEFNQIGTFKLICRGIKQMFNSNSTYFDI